MKKLLTIFAILLSFTAFGQFPNNHSVSSAITEENVKGMFSANLGLKSVPFTDTTAANLNPYVKGVPFIIISTSSDNKYWYRNSTATKWIEFGSGSSGGSGWELTGNAGTSSGTNFIGTTDAQDLVVKANSVEQFRFLSSGGVQIPNTTGSTTGVIFKGSERFIHSFALPGTATNLGQNLHIGLKAGNFTYTGSSGGFGTRNISIGDSTLYANTTGYRNAIIGTWAGAANTTGFENSILGANSFENNTTGRQNTAVGAIALENNTTGLRNTVMGFSAMQYGTTAERNTAIGGRAMQNVSTGYANAALGFDALNFNSTGDHNVALGLDALYYSNGSHNVAAGDSSLWGLFNGPGLLHVGYKNVAIGSRAGYYLGDTYSNFASIYDTAVTFLGANASRDSSVSYTTSLQNMTVIGYNARGFASNQVVLGNDDVSSTLLKGAVNIRTYGSGTHTGTPAYALSVDASGNVIEGSVTSNDWHLTGNSGTTPGTNFIGNTDNVGLMFKTNNVESGYINLIRSNTSFGYGTLSANTTGTNNVAIGTRSLFSNTTGFQNIAIGMDALSSGTGAINTTAIGFESALVLNAVNNTAIGYRTLYGNSTGINNTAVGVQALRNNTGSHNTAVGMNAIQVSSSAGSYNSAFGEGSLTSLSTGDSCVAVGFQSGYSNTTGANNLFLGYRAGAYNTTGSNQIFISTLDRISFAGDTSASPVYVAQNATATNQRIRLNGRIFMEHIPSATTDTILYYNPTTDEVTYGLKPSGGGVSGSGTTNEIAYWTSSSAIGSLTTATYPSLTELSYVKGVTSSIQTQFTGKANVTLNNLSSVAINTSLLPATDDAIDLGSASKQWKDLYLTGSSIYMSGHKILSSSALTMPTGGAVRTNTSAGNTLLLQAYDVDGTAYTTFGTLTANNTPTFDLTTSVTIGGNTILYNSGPLGTPSSGVATNLTGTATALNIGGNAATATALQTGRTINGTTFDGTSNITVTAAAGTLTGTTLNSAVVTSSLTSFGTVTSGTLSTGTVLAGVTVTVGSDANYDIYYRNSSGVFTRLAAGTDGQFLTTHGTSSAPTWTTASGTGDMILASSQSVTGLKTFDKDKLAMKGTSTGVTTISTANTSATSYTFTLPASDITAAQILDLTTSTSASTASVLMKRDANGNTSVKNIVDAYTSTATAAGTTTLTASSTFYQNFSGTSTQTVTLPDATTLTNGHQFFIMDNSTGNLTVNMNGGSLLKTVPANQYIVVTLTSNGTAAGTWTVQSSVPQTEFIRQSASYTLSNTTNIQKLFNASTNGALTVKATTTYNFEGVINVSGMSATSGNMKFDILGAGTATLTSAGWCAIGLDNNTIGTAAANGGNFTATNVSSGNIVTAGTGSAVYAFVKGTFTVNAGGTIIPSVGLTTAVGTAAVGINTWMTVTEILPGGTNYTSGWN